MAEAVRAMHARIPGSLETQPTHNAPGIVHFTEAGPALEAGLCFCTWADSRGH